MRDTTTTSREKIFPNKISDPMVPKKSSKMVPQKSCPQIYQKKTFFEGACYLTIECNPMSEF